MQSSLMDAAPDTSQDDVIGSLEASVAAFLRREPDAFESGSAWRACREFGLFSLLGSAPDSLGFSLTAYARLLVSLSRMNGQLAFAVAQANQARLLSAGGGGPDEGGFAAAVVAQPAARAGNARAGFCFESAIPPAALDTLWIVLPAGGDACLPCEVSARRIDDLRLSPLARGSARYGFLFRPASSDRAPVGADLAEASGQCLAAKQLLDGMAITQGQLWRGYELALRFCDERLIFNRRLAEFQNVRTRLADIYSRLRVLSAVISVACSSGHTHGGHPEVLAAIHRRVALRAAADLMQAFGGTAFMEDSGMPEIYSNVARLSLGAPWSFPPMLAVSAERLAREVADLTAGRLADAGSGELWRTSGQGARNAVPDRLGRILELAGLGLALEHLGAGDDGCGGALRDYWEHAVTAGMTNLLPPAYLDVSAR